MHLVIVGKWLRVFSSWNLEVIHSLWWQFLMRCWCKEVVVGVQWLRMINSSWDGFLCTVLVQGDGCGCLVVAGHELFMRVVFNALYLCREVVVGVQQLRVMNYLWRWFLMLCIGVGRWRWKWLWLLSGLRVINSLWDWFFNAQWWQRWWMRKKLARGDRRIAVAVS